LREKYIRDQVAVQEYGYIKGREEGRRSLINKMLENGATVEQIAKMLNVDVAEIENML
jgi:predicted transposase/invertase (TIGR01784 family)